MSNILTLELPDTMYLPLQRRAKKQGKNISQILLEWLNDSNLLQDEEDEPLLKMAGFFSSDLHDVSANHDFYIGQELSRTHE